MTLDEIKTKLNNVADPLTGKPFADLHAIKEVQLADNVVTVKVAPGYPVQSMAPAIKGAVRDALAAGGFARVEVEVDGAIIAHRVQALVKTLANVKNIIAVSSGKGGVGKSTVAANLALALKLEGARVGVLDADVYGPSQPLMLGAHGSPVSKDGVNMEPIESLGLEINSVGFMVDPEDPVIWRGPMAAGALQQLVKQTNWHDLDYLVVDMPPGTGDIQLTLAQTVPVTGAVVVTTPQEIALSDARKGLRMFEKVNVPILGVIENMSYFKCPDCGRVEYIFGKGGAQRFAEQYKVPLLGELPLVSAVREQSDKGLPIVAADPGSEAAEAYRRIALRMAGTIALMQKDRSRIMPTVKVVND